MPIQILFRKGMQRSLYGETIDKLVKMKGNLLIFSTGYIHNSSQYSNEEALKKIVSAINSLRDNRELTILIVGGDQGGGYPTNFKEFCDLLRCRIKQTLNVNIHFRRVVGDNWHGKVAIKVQASSGSECRYDVHHYYAAVIGSSNLTPPNILNGQFGWNREADLFFVNGDEIPRNLNRLKESGICIESIAKEIEKVNKKIKISLQKLGKDNTEILEEESRTKEKIDRLRNLFLNLCPDQNAIWGCQATEELEYWTNMKKVYEEQSKELEELYNNIVEIYNGGHCDILEPMILSFYDKIKYTDKLDIYSIRDIKKIISSMKQEIEKIEHPIHKFNIKKQITELYKGVQIIDKELQVFEPIYEVKCGESYIESIIKGIYVEMESIIRNCTKEET